MRNEDYERGYFVATQRAVNRIARGLPVTDTSGGDLTQREREEIRRRREERELNEQ